jgi:hypothetical protein
MNRPLFIQPYLQETMSANQLANTPNLSYESGVRNLLQLIKGTLHALLYEALILDRR